MCADTTTIKKITAKKLLGMMLALCLAGAHTSWATEYSVESTLKATAQHDDDINLSATDQLSLYGETFSPAANFRVKTESWDTSVNTDLRFSDFNRSGYDSDDQYVTLLSEQAGEKSKFSINANATNDTTRTSEALDSGRVSNARHKQYSLSPTWSYPVSDRNSVELSGSLSTADYDDENYAGFDNSQVYAQWSYVYTENLMLFLRANSTNYESDGRTQGFSFVQLVNTLFGPIPQQSILEQTYVTESEGAGFQVGANYLVTEKLTLYGLFGNSDTDTKYQVSDEFDACVLTANDPSWLARGACTLADQSSSSETIDSSLSWQGDEQKIAASYSSQTQPSSDGYLLQYEQLSLNWDYQLSEKNSLYMSALWGQNKTLDEPDEQVAANDSNRDFQTVSLNYVYYMTEQWSVSTEFNYRYQDYKEIDNSSAEGVGGQISLSYRPQIKQWSL